MVGFLSTVKTELRNCRTIVSSTQILRNDAPIVRIGFGLGGVISERSDL